MWEFAKHVQQHFVNLVLVWIPPCSPTFPAKYVLCCAFVACTPLPSRIAMVRGRVPTRIRAMNARTRTPPVLTRRSRQTQRPARAIQMVMEVRPGRSLIHPRFRHQSLRHQRLRHQSLRRQRLPGQSLRHHSHRRQSQSPNRRRSAWESWAASTRRATALAATAAAVL